MALQDCSELTQVIYELSRYFARTGVDDVDGVVRAINQEGITRDTVTNALYEASAAQARKISETAKRLRQIVREAKLDKKQRAALEGLADIVARGELPTREQVKATRQQTAAMAALADETNRMREAVKNMRQYAGVQELNRALAEGDVTPTPTAQSESPTPDAQTQEILDQRGEIVQERRAAEAATRNAELLQHEMAGTLPESKPRAPRPAPVQEILDQRAAILQNIKNSPAAQALRDAKTVAQLQTAIEKLHTHLQEGTLPEIKATKQRSEQVQKWVRARNEAERAVRESEPAQRAKLERELASMMQRLEESDFAKPVDEKKVASSKEVADLTFRRDSLRSAINKQIRDSKAKTIWGQLAESSMAFKALKASFDLPPLFRQGLFFAVTNPKQTAKAFASAVKAMGPDSERNYYDSMQEIRERANAPLYLRDALALKDIGAANVSAGVRAGLTPEEAAKGGGSFSLDEYADVGFLSKLGILGKIYKEGVDRSGRGFTLFLNRLRADTYDSWADAFSKTGTPDAVEGEYLARMINVLTGEGRLGSLERYAPALNVALFSPRSFIAKLQSTISEPLKAVVAEAGELTGVEEIRWPGTNAKLKLTNLAGTKKVRRAVARQYAKYIAANLTFYSLLAMALDDKDEAEVVTDPTHSMAGAVRIGNTYLDPLGGLRPTLVLASRLATGTKTTAAGKKEAIVGEDVPYAGDTMGSLVLQQLRGKLAPVPSVLANYLSNKKDFKGDDITFLSSVGDLVVPMSGQDMYDALREQGLSRGAAISGLISLGMGANTFEPTKGGDSKPKFKSRQF